MTRSREGGSFNPEEAHEPKGENKPKRVIKVFKKGGVQFKGIEEIPSKQSDEKEAATAGLKDQEKSEKESLRDFAAEIKLAVEEKQKDQDKFSKARKDFEDLFKK